MQTTKCIFAIDVEGNNVAVKGRGKHGALGLQDQMIYLHVNNVTASHVDVGTGYFADCQILQHVSSRSQWRRHRIGGQLHC
jgi:hypothetical protein